MDIKLRKTLMEPGHLACAGCGAAIAMKLVTKALEKDTRIVIPAGCWSIIIGQHPNLSVKLPNLHTPFAFAAAFATGMKAALEIKEKRTQVVVWAGDGATYDIGFGLLSAAAERNEDILYICYDNEGYMNTGAQKSSATPSGAQTTTTPQGKLNRKKNIIGILTEHNISYAATASIAFPEDLISKVEKAKNISGFRFLLILCPCPTGWQMEPSQTIKAARLAVECGIFPLVEVENGKKRVTYTPSFTGLSEYVSLQGRFKNIYDKALSYLKEEITEKWEKL